MLLEIKIPNYRNCVILAFYYPVRVIKYMLVSIDNPNKCSTVLVASEYFDLQFFYIGWRKLFDPLSPWDFVEKKTCFEASQAGFWSLSGYKKLTLNTKLFTGHTLPAFWSSSKTLASKVLICPETSFVLFYQKFDSMRVKRVHKNERKVREKDRNYKELLSLFSFVFFPHHLYLALAVDKSCMVFISIHVFEDL